MKVRAALKAALSRLLAGVILPLAAAIAFADLPMGFGKTGMSPATPPVVEARASQNGSTGNPASPDQNAAAPNAGQVTLPACTTISVRVADAVDSSRDHVGDLLTGTVDPSVLVHDQVVIPRGTEAHLRVAEDKKGGHIHGKAKVELELTSLVMNGRELEVHTNSYEKHKGAISTKAAAVAAPGAGAVAETAAGAAVGAGPGGAAAAPALAVFKSAKVKLPAGTRVPFALVEDFTFNKPPAPSPQPNSR